MLEGMAEEFSATSEEIASQSALAVQTSKDLSGQAKKLKEAMSFFYLGADS